MADYYVRTVGGSDLAAGTSHGAAYATISKALSTLNASGVKGSKIYIENDGTHTLPTSQTQISNVALLGTSYSDPGFSILGIDSAQAELGNTVPALVSTQSAATQARFFNLRAGVKYGVVKGLKFDLSTADPSNGCLFMELTDSNAGPVLIEACHAKGYADNTIGTSVRTFLNGNASVGSPNEYGEIRYCYLENLLSPLDLALASTTKKIQFHHNVVSFTGDWSNGFVGVMQIGNTVNAGNAVGFYQNTIYINENGGTTIDSVFDYGPNGGAANAGAYDAHSNYIYIETNGAVTQVFGGTAGSTDTNTGTIGFNTVRFGPSVVVGDNPGGLYQPPWDDGVDPKATDNVAYTTAAATMFNAPGSAWTWINVNSTGYNIPLPRDLRPLLNTSGSSTGGVPGALPLPNSDLSVDLITSRSAPTITDQVTLTFTLLNTGSQADSIVCSLPIPAGLTYSSAVASQGSYVSGTGVWTVGTLVNAASATLQVVVDVNDDQSGNTITVTATYTSSTITDTNSGNNTDSVTLTVVDDSDPGGGGDGANPFIDVIPIFADYLQIDAGCRLLTKVNREVNIYARSDIKRSRFREFTSKRIIVAPATTLTINMGGIQRAKYLMITADSPVEVSVSTSDDRYFPAATVIYLGPSDFEILKIHNTSSTTSANVEIAAVD